MFIIELCKPVRMVRQTTSSRRRPLETTLIEANMVFLLTPRLAVMLCQMYLTELSLNVTLNNK